MNQSRISEIKQIIAKSYGPGYSSTPDQDMGQVARILFDEAVEQFGLRLSSVEIREGITFHAGVPHIHYPMGLVSIKLSNSSYGYWSTFIYECAHETIHLLDAQLNVRFAKTIEEAVASEFSIACATAIDPSYPDQLEKHVAESRLDPVKDAFIKKYDMAQESLRSLGPNWPEIVRAIRTGGTPFHQIDVDLLKQHVPTITDTVALHLSSLQT